jgi:hypothetical protein
MSPIVPVRYTEILLLPAKSFGEEKGDGDREETAREKWRNPCHNFVTLRTKFGVIGDDWQTMYVLVLKCVML